MIRLVFTCGDVNGIGPEICVKTFHKIIKSNKRLVYFVCPLNVFKDACELTNLNIPFKVLKKQNLEEGEHGFVNLINLGNINYQQGKITKAAGGKSIQSLAAAVDLIDNKLADIIVTAPISKYSIQKAGFNFPGHTEYLASHAGTSKFLMVFLSSKLIASLATIHIPVKNISKNLSSRILSEKISILYESLSKDFGIKKPKIAVLGLNPHAGEMGNIGDEEDKIISPVLKQFKDKGICGPFVPDAFFANHSYKEFDAVLGMYHDQVLIPFKMMNFNRGVNFTAGLPFIRTSPDHGTAFDIAWKNKADCSSMAEAVKWGEKIYRNRKAFK